MKPMWDRVTNPVYHWRNSWECYWVDLMSWMSSALVSFVGFVVAESVKGQNPLHQFPLKKSYQSSWLLDRASRNLPSEVTVNRLMFGCCQLDSCLHQIGKHETGLCEACDVPETVEHYIIPVHCNNELAKAAKATCHAHDVDHTLKNINRDRFTSHYLQSESQRNIITWENKCHGDKNHLLYIWWQEQSIRQIPCWTDAYHLSYERRL